MLDFRLMLNWSSLVDRARRTQPRERVLLLVSCLVVTGIAWSALRSLSAMPDFREYEAGPERKSAFFDFVRPLVEAENKRVLRARKRLLALAADDDPGFIDRRWLAGMAKDYAIDDPDPGDPALVNQLLLRVDSVPLSLALAQAAKESGWGTSRFARDGNNLYGERCFDAGCGLVPGARSAALGHEVEKFGSPRQSVASYLNNINTHAEYKAFRRDRARSRGAKKTLSGIALAENLTQYSERRDVYVKEIQQLIRSNNLE